MSSKLRISVTLLFFVVVVGVLGFKIYMGLSWVDALYMTVITITTVGYREITEPSEVAKLFTVFFILISV
ncbi:ion channel, partial [Nonlabens sp.]